MAKKKRGSGVTRIDPNLQTEVEKLLDKNDNRVYCDSVPSFIKIAVRELLDSIRKNKDRIRLEKK